MTQKFDNIVFRKLINRHIEIDWQQDDDSIENTSGILREIYENSIMMVDGNEEIYVLKDEIISIKTSRRYGYVRGKKVNNKSKSKDKRHYERNR